MEELLIQKRSPQAILPTRATQGSAGYDLSACLLAPIILQSGEIAKIPTGLAIAIGTPNWVGLVYARSGLATKQGVAPVNCVGVIDSDYRGELLVPLMNHGRNPVTISHGDRIAQLVFTPVGLPTLVEVATLPPTLRGSGGFGSTDLPRSLQ